MASMASVSAVEEVDDPRVRSRSASRRLLEDRRQGGAASALGERRDRARIGRNCLIAAGALIPPEKEIPDGSVVMGSPGKIVRQVTDRDLAMMRHACQHYIERGREYRELLKVAQPDY